MSTNDFYIGMKVRHIDGGLGTVTGVHCGAPGERLIEWKTCGTWRVSGEAALKSAEFETYRWSPRQGSGGGQP